MVMAAHLQHHLVASTLVIIATPSSTLVLITCRSAGVMSPNWNDSHREYPPCRCHAGSNIVSEVSQQTQPSLRRSHRQICAQQASPRQALPQGQPQQP